MTSLKKLMKVTHVFALALKKHNFEISLQSILKLSKIGAKKCDIQIFSSLQKSVLKVWSKTRYLHVKKKA